MDRVKSTMLKAVPRRAAHKKPLTEEQLAEKLSQDKMAEEDKINKHDAKVEAQLALPTPNATVDAHLGRFGLLDERWDKLNREFPLHPRPSPHDVAASQRAYDVAEECLRISYTVAHQQMVRQQQQDLHRLDLEVMTVRQRHPAADAPLHVRPEDVEHCPLAHPLTSRTRRALAGMHVLQMASKGEEKKKQKEAAPPVGACGVCWECRRHALGRAHREEHLNMLRKHMHQSWQLYRRHRARLAVGNKTKLVWRVPGPHYVDPKKAKQDAKAEKAKAKEVALREKYGNGKKSKK